MTEDTGEYSGCTCHEHTCGLWVHYAYWAQRVHQSHEHIGYTALVQLGDPM